MPFKSSVSQGYLLALTSKISDLAYEFAAERVLVMGRLVCASFVRSERYSMGGFGAFQLGGFAPDAFDLVMSVAGYGLGTLEPQGRETSQRLSETFKRLLSDFSSLLCARRHVWSSPAGQRRDLSGVPGERRLAALPSSDCGRRPRTEGRHVQFHGCLGLNRLPKEMKRVGKRDKKI